MKKTISEQAQAFRLSKNWSATRMAKEVGCNRQDIAGLESNPGRMPHYIDGLARVMGCTAGDLMAGTCLDAAIRNDDPPTASLEATLKSLSLHLSELDPSDRVDAMRLIDRLAESPERHAKTAAAIRAMMDAPFVQQKQA